MMLVDFKGHFRTYLVLQVKLDTLDGGSDGLYKHKRNVLALVRRLGELVSAAEAVLEKITHLGDGSGDSSHQKVDGELRSGDFLLGGLRHLVLCSYLANRRVKRRMSSSPDPSPDFFCAKKYPISYGLSPPPLSEHFSEQHSSNFSHKVLMRDPTTPQYDSKNH